MFYLGEFDIRNVVLKAGNVGRGEAESNIARREHDISNVGRHGVEQMVCRPHKGLLFHLFLSETPILDAKSD